TNSFILDLVQDVTSAQASRNFEMLGRSAGKKDHLALRVPLHDAAKRREIVIHRIGFADMRPDPTPRMQLEEFVEIGGIERRIGLGPRAPQHAHHRYLLKSSWLNASCGMSPLAKPITSRRPSVARHFTAVSP